MRAITNLAVKEGYIHPSFADQVKAVGSSGRLHKVSDFINKRRAAMGLPPIASGSNEVQEIFKITGLDKIVDLEGSE
jgi:hypothetical protein